MCVFGHKFLLVDAYARTYVSHCVDHILNSSGRRLAVLDLVQMQQFDWLALSNYSLNW